MSEPNPHAGVVTHDLAMESVNAVGTRITAEVAFGYDPADPYAVTATFRTATGDVAWTFARDLLARGLTDPAGEGNVHLWPCLDASGRAAVTIELCSPDGELVVRARTADIYRFVSRSLAAVPAGLENDHLDLDHLIEQLQGWVG
jgi:hypothetical protein